MFVCRRSVFKKSCSRDHQSVFVIATNDVSWPVDALHIQKHVRLHVRFKCLIRHRVLFFSFRTLRLSFPITTSLFSHVSGFEPHCAT